MRVSLESLSESGKSRPQLDSRAYSGMLDAISFLT